MALKPRLTTELLIMIACCHVNVLSFCINVAGIKTNAYNVYLSMGANMVLFFQYNHKSSGIIIMHKT